MSTPYTVEDAIATHHTLVQDLNTHGPDHVYLTARELDPELLATLVVLHTLKQ